MALFHSSRPGSAEKKGASGLNSAQQEAVAHGEGPALVLAGPGSGKTTVITRRVERLVKEAGVSGQNILVITFTRAAAEEMRSRYVQMNIRDSAENRRSPAMSFLEPGGTAGSDHTPAHQLPSGQSQAAGTGGVTFGTFHSVFFRVLRAAYRFDASSILGEGERFALISEIAAKLETQIPDLNEFASTVLSEISLVKNNAYELEHYYARSCSDRIFRQIYTAYDDRLKAAGKLDYDDILSLTLELFTKRPDILDAWQERWKYILIDEFQDINITQYRTICLMAGKYRNLFVVGDDDQSIYRFRGASPQIMLGFFKDFPDAKRITLNVNYRSDANIIAASENLISHNKKRYAKHMQPSHKAKQPITLKICRDAAEENRIIAENIRKQMDAGIAPEQIAVLFRTNLGARMTMDTLMRAGIPFHMRDSLPNIFTHWIALDLLAYLRIVFSPGSRADWLRIMNRPNRYLKREALSLAQPPVTGTLPGQRVTNPESVMPFRFSSRNAAGKFIRREENSLDAAAPHAPEASLHEQRAPEFSSPLTASDRAHRSRSIILDNFRSYYADKDWMLDRIDRLSYDLKIMEKMAPYAAIHYIGNAMGYLDFLKAYAGERNIPADDLNEVFEAVHESARGFHSLEEWQAHIEDYTEKLKEQASRSRDCQKEEGVCLCTLHGAKGLEFPIVIIPDINEDNMPHSRAASDADLEEERRLFYVGITRAMKTLQLFAISGETGRKKAPSRFLAELDASLKNRKL